jgi:predicted nucleic acid-binding protein
VWIKFLTLEEPRELGVAATRLVLQGLSGDRLIAPAFAWAEIGSVLRKKLRQGVLQAEQAEALWTQLGELPIEFVDVPILRRRAWELAKEYGLPTLYDAAFLACTEVVEATPGSRREFWTADRELIRALGTQCPPYLRQLGFAAGT